MQFDAFQKSKDHVQVRTLGGATISVAAGLVMLLLFVSELVYWRTVRVEDHLVVDRSQADRDFDIELDVTFHALKCTDVRLVSEDAKGMPYDETRTALTRLPLSLAPDMGSRALTPAAAAHMAAGLPESAYHQPGCRILGRTHVKRVPGHLHVAAPRVLSNMDGRLVFTVPPEALATFNASHTIHRLTFGPTFPGQISPLNGVTSGTTSTVASAYQYHLRVVPTLYEPLYGRHVVDSQQYSVTDFVQEHLPGAGVMVHPGLWLRYDFSPIMVRRVEVRRTFLQFLTSLCAILGGVFAISGLVDQLLYRATETRKSK